MTSTTAVSLIASSGGCIETVLLQEHDTMNLLFGFARQRQCRYYNLPECARDDDAAAMLVDLSNHSLSHKYDPFQEKQERRRQEEKEQEKEKQHTRQMKSRRTPLRSLTHRDVRKQKSRSRKCQQPPMDEAEMMGRTTIPKSLSNLSTSATASSSKVHPSPVAVSYEIARSWLEMGGSQVHHGAKHYHTKARPQSFQNCSSKRIHDSAPAFSNHPTQSHGNGSKRACHDFGTQKTGVVTTPSTTAKRTTTSKRETTPGFTSFSSRNNKRSSRAKSDILRYYSNLLRVPPPPPPQNKKNKNSNKRICFGVMVDWKSAVDPKSGRTYYYNVKTRETQWRKPMELATEAERAEMERKERKQKDFFAAMEANILKNIMNGQTTPESSPPQPQARRKSSLKAIPRPDMIRTISGMDETVLRQLVTVRNVDMGSGPLSSRQHNASLSSIGRSNGKRNVLEMIEETSKEEFEHSSLDFLNGGGGELGESSFFAMSEEETKALQDLAQISQEMVNISDQEENLDFSANLNYEFEPELDAVHEDKSVQPDDDELGDLRSSLSTQTQDLRHVVDKPALKKRNTCGTLYVGTTMSAPDKDATIKCVCGVYRAHILGAEEQEGETYDHREDEHRMFNDRESQRKEVGQAANEEEELSLDELKLDEEEREVPELDDITAFYRDVFTKAQMESDCIIMSLVYVERLIKATGGLLRPRRSNWRSLLFSSMVLSSKVWDDLSMWNADFSQTCPTGVQFSLQRINELECAVLNALRYKVKVPASEYAKYYFLLRSMLIKSGLGGDELKTMSPLDLQGAKKLQTVSSGFQKDKMAAAKARMLKQEELRSKSMGDAEKARMLQGARRANLEHFVKL